MKPAISVVLDTRRALNTGPHKGKYPIKLKATFQVSSKGNKQWQAKYYPLHIYCTKKEFASASANPRNAQLKAIKTAMIEAQAKANKIVEKFSFLNPEKFARLYEHKETAFEVKAIFDDYIQQLEDDDRIGNAEAYRNAKASILKHSSDQLQFVEVSPAWLKKYESTMLKAGRSRTTVGMYLRCLRKIFNIAIDEHLITSDLYPFSRYGFKIPTTRSRKIALDEKQKNQLLKFSSTDPLTKKALDFWAMSYYCNGINFADIARIRRRQLQPDALTLYRQKSKNTARDIVPIVVPLRAEVKTIIARHGVPSLNPKNYVFDIITDEHDAKQQKRAIHQWIKKTNEKLDKVGQALGFSFKLTTYTARHTFATIALRKGASKAFIQEALGHADMKTTEAYLGGLDFETKKAISDKL